MLGAFLSYYRLWLPSFEQHAAHQRVWEVEWTSALGAWGLVGAVTVFRLSRNPSALRTTSVQFFVCSAGGGEPVFARPVLQTRSATAFYSRLRVVALVSAGITCVAGSCVWSLESVSDVTNCSVCGLLLVTDNPVFRAVHSWRQYHRKDGFHLDVHDRVLLSELCENCDTAVLLTESESLNYLLPAYARQRPWLGHQFNTPDFPQRREMMRQCFAGNTVTPVRFHRM